MIQLQLHYFREKAGSIQDEDENLLYDEFDELDKIEYFETNASKLITKGDIAVMRTGDDHLNDVYYIDYGKRAIISYFDVLEIILLAEIVHEVKYVKLVPVYVISSNKHQALCELVDEI